MNEESYGFLFANTKKTTMEVAL